MKYISWIITVPLALILVSFSISNRSPVTLELLPLPFTVETPVFVAVLGGSVTGFLVGGFIAWASGSRARSRARSQGYRADAAEREIRRLKDRISEMEATAAATATTTVPKKALPSTTKAEAA